MSMRHRPLVGSPKLWGVFIATSTKRRTLTHPATAARRSSSSTSFPDFRTIDQTWRSRWEKSHLWTREGAREKKYILPMFAYPSGALHLGHLRVYTISDVIARFHRMKGAEVLHPLGWDAFGLPAENAAKERGIDPADWTLSNIRSMKEQILGMGGCWSWDRELRTCDPAYYAETQRIFLELYRQGLAYQAEAEVNYDPVDRTVLANEQVDADGFSWRSGAKVEKIALKQWFFKITKFNEDLLDGLKHLEKQNSWPPQVISMQRNWLGKSLKAEIDFDIQYDPDSGVSQPLRERFPSLTVFTTRPDTVLGVQYIALSPRHPLVQALAPDISAEDFSQPTAGKLLMHLQCIHPSAPAHARGGQTLSKLPIYVAGYVKDGKGTGAVMGVPAHDATDHAFYQKMCNDSGSEARMNVVIRPSPSSTLPDVSVSAFTERGYLTEACGPELSGVSSEDAAEKLVESLGHRAHPIRTWKIRDWLISRQRYWGAPIPIVHCPSCGPVPVPAEQLPIELPQLSSEAFRRNDGNPLEHAQEWVDTSCPSCGDQAKRETDTMDTFVDSSWYFLRFAQGHAGGTSFMPVDVYIGGVEHAILHLLYARFMTKALQGTLFFASETTQTSIGEPFTTLLAQGMVHGQTYSDPRTGRFLKPDEIDKSDPKNVKIKLTGERPNTSFEKMSKSKHNGVEPTSFIEQYGADTTRAHMLFQAPVSEILNWDEGKIVGVQRWFGRVWHVAHTLGERRLFELEHKDTVPSNRMEYRDDDERDLWRTVQMTIKSVGSSYEKTFALNTIVSDLMSLTNKISSATSTDDLTLYRAFNTLLRLLTPIAPSFAEECWQVLHCSEVAPDFKNTASHAGFPEPDGTLEALYSQTHSCAVQIGGKFRFATTIAQPPSEVAASSENLSKWVLQEISESHEGKEYFSKYNIEPTKAKRVIVVKGGRTVNLLL